METKVKKKSFRIGTLRTGEFAGKPSVYLSLGDMRNTNPDYNRSIEVIVRDSNGNVLHKQENGIIFLNDPRLIPGKDPDKVPDFIRYELNVSSK